MEAATKRRQHTRGKGRFGAENAELKNTALKRRDRCSMSRCMSYCNYPSLHSAIRMRIRGSETHTAGQARGGGGVGGRLEFHGSDLSPACREDVWTAEEGKWDTMPISCSTKPQPEWLSSDIRFDVFSSILLISAISPVKNESWYFAASNLRKKHAQSRF